MTEAVRSGASKHLAGGAFAALIAANAAGAACIIGNWWQAATTGERSSDLSSAGLGVVGVVVAVVANTLWLLAARGAITRRRVHLSSRVAGWAAPLDTPALHVAAGPSAAPSQPPAPQRIAVEGATLYHRPGCSLVARKRTASAAAEDHQASGLRPCGVCEPGLVPAPDGARP